MVNTIIEPRVAKTLAPEDIRAGDFITILTIVREAFPDMYDDTMPAEQRARAIRVATTPESRPAILRVEAVCLPLVLTVKPDGKPRVLDTRRVRLARVDTGFGCLVFQRLKDAKEAANTEASGPTGPPPPTSGTDPQPATTPAGEP